MLSTFVLLNLKRIRFIEMTDKDFLTRYRGWIIFLIVVPFSFIYQKIEDITNWYYRTFVNTDKHHDRLVDIIRGKVMEARKTGRKMVTSRAPWKTMSIRTANKSEYVQIPLNLRNILGLNPGTMTLRVEPMATMGDVTSYLVPRGYALAVQVEMDDLTVGGLCMGIGIETSSHKYGFLFETITAYEIVNAEGELIRATKEENFELFHALPMSHGTLGFLVGVELQIVPVKKYMKVKYLPFHSMRSLSQKLHRLTEAGKESFVEALIYSGQSGVIMTGEFADQPGKDGKRNTINNWYKPWFYTYVERFLEKGESTEYIPLRHYYHRHTPSIFFQLRDLIPFANEGWYRWMFAWMGAPKVSLMKYSMTKELRKRSLNNRVAQDILIPLRDLEETIKIADVDYGIYPIWICPVRLYDKGELEGFIRNPKETIDETDYEMFVDVGIYGIPPSVQKGTWDAIDISRKLERYTRSLGGFHMLYADIFMNRSEFEEMFSHKLYRKLRKDHRADEVFPEVYDKVKPEKWLIDVENEFHQGQSQPKVPAVSSE